MQNITGQPVVGDDLYGRSFAGEAMPEFKEREEERERAKIAELAPYLKAAMRRKIAMRELADDDLPTFVSLGRRMSEESKHEDSIYQQRAAAE